MSNRIGSLTSVEFRLSDEDNDFPWQLGNGLLHPSFRGFLHVSNVLGDIDKQSIFMRIDEDGSLLFERGHHDSLSTWRLPPDYRMEFDIVKNNKVLTSMIWNP